MLQGEQRDVPIKRRHWNARKEQERLGVAVVLVHEVRYRAVVSQHRDVVRRYALDHDVHLRDELVPHGLNLREVETRGLIRAGYHQELRGTQCSHLGRVSRGNVAQVSVALLRRRHLVRLELVAHLVVLRIDERLVLKDVHGVGGAVEVEQGLEHLLTGVDEAVPLDSVEFLSSGSGPSRPGAPTRQSRKRLAELLGLFPRREADLPWQERFERTVQMLELAAHSLLPEVDVRGVLQGGCEHFDDVVEGREVGAHHSVLKDPDPGRWRALGKHPLQLPHVMCKRRVALADGRADL
mmetsp:Transcript_11452/g.37623  ORF Transcript_11452/g.37623 Transcript_11452/m.37623 type:complete len:295 (-) Transcript_11452:181-1065(-)